MKHFHYSALTAAGELVSGNRAAPDETVVIAWLHEQGLLPIAAAEDEPRRAMTRISQFWPERALPGRDLALVSQQLARLLKAGLALDRALGILIELAPSLRLRGALQNVLDRVRDGATLAEALAAQGKSFPEMFVTLVRAGEMSGALQAVLGETAAFLERADAIRQKIISAMIYPAILIGVATLSVGLILTTVLPQFEPMFKEAGANLPFLTQIVVMAGDAVRGYWWAMAACLVGAVMGWRAAMRHPPWAAARDRLVLSLPVIGFLVLRAEIGRFCRTLGVMLANGVTASAALTLAGGTLGNGVLKAAVDDAASRFREGEGLSAPLARSGRFPTLAIQLIRIGEETGRLDDMLGEIADLFDQEVQRGLERLLAALVPGITLVMGGLIALIVGAVMTALMSVNALAG